MNKHEEILNINWGNPLKLSSYPAANSIMVQIQIYLVKNGMKYVSIDINNVQPHQILRAVWL